MNIRTVDEAMELVDKLNAGLEPELLSVADAQALLERYSQLRSKVSFGVAALAARVDDAGRLAKLEGTSLARAKETVKIGKVLANSAPLSDAFKHGEISLDQAAEIARAEGSAPGAAESLVNIATERSFAVLREQARKVKLDAEQHHDLSSRQHRARTARGHPDELGMINIHLAFEPHVGTPIQARAEAQAQRLARAVKREDREPFERYLSDAYAQMLSGSSVNGRARRPELVVVVSHEVAQRG